MNTKTVRSSILVSVLAAGCVEATVDDLEAVGQAAHGAGTPSACLTRNADGDGDGIDDGVEDCLLARHAPVLYLPRALDWTNPGNVDWFLARSTLRFHHGDGCRDCEIIPRGVTQQALVAHRHQTMSGLFGWPSCRHRNEHIASNGGPWKDDQHFFLQMLDDADHAGPGDPAAWRVYGHVHRNRAGGLDVQYWFFYPYNDSVGTINHEGDWEMVTVRTGGDGAALGTFFCAHGDCSTFRTPGEMTWFGHTHPVVWVADGSHASYPSAADCEGAVKDLPGPSCQTEQAFRWFTGAGDRGGEPGLQGGGVLNVGERGRPLNDQQFIRYYSRWGELGQFGFTSGPITPTYKPSWMLD